MGWRCLQIPWATGNTAAFQVPGSCCCRPQKTLCQVEEPHLPKGSSSIQHTLQSMRPFVSILSVVHQALSQLYSIKIHSPKRLSGILNTTGSPSAIFSCRRRHCQLPNVVQRLGLQRLYVMEMDSKSKGQY